MNTKQYGIRKKGDGEYLVTFERLWTEKLGGLTGFYQVYLDEFSHGCHEEWLVSHVDTAIECLNKTSCLEPGSSMNPLHSLNTEDYEVVCVERKVTVVESGE